MNPWISRVTAVTIALLLTALAAQAQWVAVARAVSGRIQQMQQKSANGQGGYDVATVVIEANAQKVYETAMQRVQAHSGEVKLIAAERHARASWLSPTARKPPACRPTPLGDKLTQLVVASTLDPARPSATSLVVKSIQNVCTELKVECTLQTD